MIKIFYGLLYSLIDCGFLVASVFFYLEFDGGWGFWECIVVVDVEVSLVRSSNVAIFKFIINNIFELKL